VGDVSQSGDNFYDWGLREPLLPLDHEDRERSVGFNMSLNRVAVSFEDVYLPRLPPDTPFYALAGNHDHLGDVTMQLAYAALQPQWNFPHLYHTFTQRPADRAAPGPSVQVVVIDTMVRRINTQLKFCFPSLALEP
jgi:hypothetical protein